jgi:hypothetical protein
MENELPLVKIISSIRCIKSDILVPRDTLSTNISEIDPVTELHSEFPNLILFHKGNCSLEASAESMYKGNEVSFINLLSSQLNSHSFILSFPLALLCSFL